MLFSWQVILLVVLGLVLGSFLNSVIWRLKVGKSIAAKHSLCPHCRQELSAKELVPLLSFALQRGHCRHCRERISWQYPAVEAASAGLFVLFFLHFGLTWALLVNLVFLLFLIVIFVYDLRYYLILDIVTVPAIIFALAANLLLGFSLLNLLLAGAIGGGFFLLQFLVSNGRWIGGGDIRLGFLLGLMSGWPGILVTLVIAYFLGAVVGLVLVAARKKDLSSRLPFGVFLTAAAVIAILYSQPIIDWYLRLVWF